MLVTDSEGNISYTTSSFEFILKRDIESIYNNSLPDVLSLYLTIEEKRHLEQCIENFKPELNRFFPILIRVIL